MALLSKNERRSFPSDDIFLPVIFQKSGFGGGNAETKEEENKLAIKNIKLQTEDIFPEPTPFLPGGSV